MAYSGQNGSARCVLCPAACELQVVSAGPDRWRSEFPLTDETGLCPRGSTLGELLGHPQRIFSSVSRKDGSLKTIPMADALGTVLAESAGRKLVFLVDAHIPIEQMLEVAAWCTNWSEATFCLVVEPAEKMLLLGTEESGADYLTDDQLADCDGFLIIGDAFAADPICARSVFDRRKAQSQTPIATLDAAAGTATKFATHRVEAAVGRQREALAAVAKAAGAKVDADLPGAAGGNPSAAAAGGALAKCKRLGVIVAAEYGRGEDWQQIGRLAGVLGRHKGGGVGVQTVGLNALAAVRLNAALGGVGLAEAISDASTISIALGADLLGMFGWRGGGFFAAAAALPNPTTDVARFVLPITMPGEWAGTYLRGGSELVRVEPLLVPPAGIPSPAELVGAMARQAGVSRAKPADVSAALQRVASASASPPLLGHSLSPSLLLARRAAHHGCGMWSAHGSWQMAAKELPDIRIGVGYAQKLKIPNLAVVTVRAGRQELLARARYAPELDGEYVVLPEGLPGARVLVQSFIESESGALSAEPIAVDLIVA